MDFASLYKQVKEDKDTITSLLSSINTSPNNGLSYDADNNLVVSGVKIKTNATLANTLPNTYHVGISYEIKDFATIGLTSVMGFINTYCIVVTYRYENSEGSSDLITPFQIAYNDSLLAYGRKAVSETEWDAWTAVTGTGSGGTAFLTSITKPTTQSVDEYWAQNVNTIGGYAYGGNTSYAYVSVTPNLDTHVLNTSESNIIIDKLYGNTVGGINVTSPITLKVSSNPSTDEFNGSTYEIPIIASDTETYPNPLELEKLDTTTDTIELNKITGMWVVMKRVGQETPIEIILSPTCQTHINNILSISLGSYIWFEGLVQPTMDAWVPRGVYPIHPDVFSILRANNSTQLEILEDLPTTYPYFTFLSSVTVMDGEIYEHSGTFVTADTAGLVHRLYPKVKLADVLGFPDTTDQTDKYLYILDGVLSYRTISWGNINNIPEAFNPTAHASTHASGGSDPIDVIDITQGGTSGKTAAEALTNLGVPGAINAGWKLQASYTVAGAFTWTAPDLFNGQDYKIGVVRIGGGGSGNTAIMPKAYASGGCAGRMVPSVETVSPGTEYTIIVGKGGASVIQNAYAHLNGNPGGSTSAFGKVAYGAPAVTFNYQNSDNHNICGQSPSNFTDGIWGGEQYSIDIQLVENTSDSSYYYEHYFTELTRCINPFTGEKLFGSGGGAYAYYNSGVYYNTAYNGGKNPLNGLGGGNGASTHNGPATAASASLPGCGGGGAVVYYDGTVYTATSGAGADGAVYIYVQGVNA